ncbi:hypothetical protein BSKO_04437 [Bryopsis sp. KO-2023]|nr:hypothetical protein BSKO_04437 [Bryopsis sp. KO-2023]
MSNKRAEQSTVLTEEEGLDGLNELWNGGTIGPDFNDDDPMFMTDKFRMYCYKVLPCSKRFCHDWSTCPFAHFSERAKRRDPRAAKYTAIACPEMKKQGEPCPRGDKCPYSHNTFEYWLHPTRYRTRMCRDGENCTRKVCFFAHKPENVRVPPCRPSLPVADDPWPASDDSADSGFEPNFSPDSSKSSGHRRANSVPSEAASSLSGRLSDMLKKIPSRPQSNGFHQPCSQDLGSTFFEKVLESIKENSVSAPSESSPPVQKAVPSPAPAPAQDDAAAQLNHVVTNLLGNLYLNQSVPVQQPLQQPMAQQIPPPNAFLEALANQVSMAPQVMPAQGIPQGIPSPATVPAMPVEGVVPSGIPMGYMPAVVPGGMPPGFPQVVAPVSGIPTQPVMGSLPVHSMASPQQGVPFPGVNSAMMPDAITSANGVMSGVANGTNMNELIQTILNLQSHGQHPANGAGQHVGGDVYMVSPQENGIPIESAGSVSSNGTMPNVSITKAGMMANGGNIATGVAIQDGNSVDHGSVPSPRSPSFMLSSSSRTVSGLV